MSEGPHVNFYETEPIDRGLAPTRLRRRAPRAAIADARKPRADKSARAREAAAQLATRPSTPLTALQQATLDALTSSPEPVRAVAARGSVTSKQAVSALRFLQGKDLAVYTGGGWRAA